MKNQIRVEGSLYQLGVFQEKYRGLFGENSEVGEIRKIELGEFPYLREVFSVTMDNTVNHRRFVKIVKHEGLKISYG